MDRTARRVRLSGGARSGDLVGKRLRLRVGCDPQLALQCLAAALVLSEGFASPSGACIGAHQRPLSGLGQRVEQDQPAPGLNGGIVLASCIAFRRQPVQDVADHGERTVALRRQPFLKRLRSDVKIGKKFTSIQTGCHLQLGTLL